MDKKYINLKGPEKLLAQIFCDPVPPIFCDFVSLNYRNSLRRNISDPVRPIFRDSVSLNYGDSTRPNIRDLVSPILYDSTRLNCRDSARPKYCATMFAPIITHISNPRKKPIKLSLPSMNQKPTSTIQPSQ